MRCMKLFSLDSNLGNCEVLVGFQQINFYEIVFKSFKKRCVRLSVPSMITTEAIPRNFIKRFFNPAIYWGCSSAAQNQILTN